MSPRPKQRFVAWLCLVAYLFAGVFEAPGLVLCIGPDGHAAIELACDGSGCCGFQPAEQTGDSEASRQVDAPTVARCTDVPLLLRDGSVPQHSPKGADKACADHLVSWVVLPAGLWLPAAVELPQPGTTDPPWRKQQLFRHQRSVVLLI